MKKPAGMCDDKWQLMLGLGVRETVGHGGDCGRWASLESSV